MRPTGTQSLTKQDLSGTIELLRRYRKNEHLEQAIADFAHAEAYEEDPFRTSLVPSDRDSP